MTAPPIPSYAGHRFPAEIISYTVWLYFRFPLSLRHVDEILAARGITVSHKTSAAVGPEVRSERRQSDPPQAAPCWRHVAPRRGCREDRREEGSVAKFAFGPNTQHITR